MSWLWSRASGELSPCSSMISFSSCFRSSMSDVV